MSDDPPVAYHAALRKLTRWINTSATPAQRTFRKQVAYPHLYGDTPEQLVEFADKLPPDPTDETSNGDHHSSPGE